MSTREERQTKLRERLTTRLLAEEMVGSFCHSRLNLNDQNGYGTDRAYIDKYIETILDRAEKHGEVDKLNLLIGLPTNAEQARLDLEADRRLQTSRHRQNIVVQLICAFIGGGLVGSLITTLIHRLGH